MCEPSKLTNSFNPNPKVRTYWRAWVFYFKDMQRTIEERRATTTQYMIFKESSKINASKFVGVEVGKKFRLEDGKIYEVYKIQHNDFLDIEFLFLQLSAETIWR